MHNCKGRHLLGINNSPVWSSGEEEQEDWSAAAACDAAVASTAMLNCLMRLPAVSSALLPGPNLACDDDFKGVSPPAGVSPSDEGFTLGLAAYRNQEKMHKVAKMH